MGPDVMQRIFNPFEQGNRSFEHRFGGLGLGLAISKSLAQAQGGTLTAQSDGANRGSTFTLSMQALPQGEAARVASKAVTDSARQALKVLLVDDHHDTCAALEQFLARGGHMAAVGH